MRKKRFITFISLILIAAALMLAVSGCQTGKATKASTTNLILATTTSLQDSGLLDELVPAFERRHTYKVKTLALGTGEALATAARGEADVILVHAPKAELKFKADGYGVKRRSIAYNYFMIVGPPRGPAKVSTAKNVVAAFKQIAEKQALFISRADDSGTNKRELTIWKSAGVSPVGPWYLEAGQGMGKTLQLANEKQAYTLSDSATFMAMRERLSLKILKSHGPALINTYSVMLVNQAKFKNIKLNTRGAAEFSRFLFSSEAQKIIRDFGREKYGQPLFYLLKKD